MKIFRGGCKVVSKKCHCVKMYGGVEEKLRELLTTSYDGRVVSFAILLFIPEETVSNAHWEEGWMVSRVCLDVPAKIRILVVQPLLY
jgi:hypothetical protein